MLQPQYGRRVPSSRQRAGAYSSYVCIPSRVARTFSPCSPTAASCCAARSGPCARAATNSAPFAEASAASPSPRVSADIGADMLHYAVPPAPRRYRAIRRGGVGRRPGPTRARSQPRPWGGGGGGFGAVASGGGSFVCCAGATESPGSLLDGRRTD
eukprot:scaffold1618_cov397-Prasinococcus_capsulatus_cf.AAC.3